MIGVRTARHIRSIGLAVALGSVARMARASDITLDVDASEAPRKILHVHMSLPAAAGTLSLSYPKWIPGEHAPTGPVTDVAGLRVSAGGKPLVWRRDLVDMYRIDVDVPSGANAVDVAFDFLSAAGPEGFSSAASATEELLVLSWNQVLFYPTGEPSDRLAYVASLTLPSGWKYGTALPLDRAEGTHVRFAPASLTTLIDSPVLAGAHFRSVDLSPGQTPRHSIDMACDSDAGLEMPAAQITNYRNLIAESYALFGARHYRDYHFLLTLSDHVAHFGLEHHESSDDRSYERMWLNDDQRIASSNLMPHELVHSWNGKYRRPAGLATPDYQQPMKDDLLWVYEGLTQYLGFVLGARSGVRTQDQARQALALLTAALDHEPGRGWRPLHDTAAEAPLLYSSSRMWRSWRRGTDFYDEGLLVWLEADVTIRRASQGKRSLDDFCKRFHGGTSGPPMVVPYTLDDVVAALQTVQPHDWRGFFAARIDSLTPHPPLRGLEDGGWKLTYVDSIPAVLKSLESANEFVDLTTSIGLRISSKDGTIEDVIPGMAAAAAGMAPGMKLVAVNGRHWSRDVLRDAVRATSGTAPLELLADNGEFYRTYRLSYHGGPRFPRLERVAGRQDLLSAILAPRATRPQGKR